MTWPDIGWWAIAVCCVSLSVGLAVLARRVHKNHLLSDGSSTEHVPIR